METLLKWVRDIIRIGVFTFLSRLGWRALLGLLVLFIALVVLVALIVVLLLQLVF